MNEHRLTEKNARTIIAIGIVVIIAIALFGFFTIFVIPAHAPTTSTKAGAQKTYTSATYGYTFNYPDSYTIQEYSPQYVSVGTPSGAAGFDSVAEADVLTAETSDTASSFSDFAHTQAELTCAADGPSSSIDCPNVSRSTTFTTASGLLGEMFYLTQATHSLAAGNVVETERGPYYAFDLSMNTPFRVLLVRPPSATAPDAINEAIVTAIAHSVRTGAP